MNLLCPHCARQLQVPEQYAGTLMKCPICEKTFTVPVLPTTPAAAPPPPPPPQPAAPQMAPSAPAASFEKTTTTSAPPGYHHTRTLVISPRLVPLVAPLSLLVVLGLMFLTWAGLFPVGEGVVTQSAFQAAIGDVTLNKNWDAYAGKQDSWSNFFGSEVTPLKSPGISLLMLAYLGVFFVTLVLALGSTAFSLHLIAIQPPAGLAGLWPYRSLVVAGLALFSLVILVIISIIGLPLQGRSSDQANAIVQELKKNEHAAPGVLSETSEARWAIEKGVRESGMGYRTTTWFSLALFFNFLAVIGAGLTAWLDTRTTQPPPRLDLIW